MRIKLFQNWIVVIIIGHCLQMTAIAQDIENEEDSIIYDFIPDVHFDSIQNRLLQINSDIPLYFNTRVKGFIDYFTVRNREYTRKALANSYYYFPIFEKYLKQYGLPDELKYLSIIESGLNPRAISRASAVGLWQFVPSTGSYYNLHQDWYIDERMDPYAATEAACKYLQQLHDYFDDWELALAAYNSGPGRVRQAIRRSGYKKSFWEIHPWLPRETRSYVPQFVAITYAMHFASEHNIFFEEPNYTINYDTVKLSRYFHLPTFADQINVCMEDLEKLNPHVKRGALPKNSDNFELRIPVDLKQFVVSNRSMLYDTASKVGEKELDYLSRSSVGSTYGRNKIRYKVKLGDVLGTIAMKYGVRVTDLKKWNNLRGNMIRIGQNLNVWVLPTYYSRLNSKPIAKTIKEPVELDGKKVHYVESGDTLWDISRMYEGLTVERLRQLNKLDNNNIKPGMPLVIGETD